MSGSCPTAGAGPAYLLREAKAGSQQAGRVILLLKPRAEPDPACLLGDAHAEREQTGRVKRPVTTLPSTAYNPHPEFSRRLGILAIPFGSSDSIGVWIRLKCDCHHEAIVIVFVAAVIS
jgi:hypothetical protein